MLFRSRETNEDVNLYIFNSSGDWSRDEDYNIGEYNIYRLPDLNDFDGIIVDLNNIRYSEVREYVTVSYTHLHDHAFANGYTVVREIGGHGVGLEFHEEPWVGYNSKRVRRC